MNDFPRDVDREILCAARAGDVTSRLSHIELAILHLAASGAGASDPERCRQIVETAVFTRIAFAEARE